MQEAPKERDFANSGQQENVKRSPYLCSVCCGLACSAVAFALGIWCLWSGMYLLSSVQPVNAILVSKTEGNYTYNPTSDDCQCRPGTAPCSSPAACEVPACPCNYSIPSPYYEFIYTFSYNWSHSTIVSHLCDLNRAPIYYRCSNTDV